MSKRSIEEVVNDTLWDSLESIVDIPDDFDYSKVGDMLEHDKPEGEDILDNLARLGEKVGTRFLVKHHRRDLNDFLG